MAVWTRPGFSFSAAPPAQRGRWSLLARCQGAGPTQGVSGRPPRSARLWLHLAGGWSREKQPVCLFPEAAPGSLKFWKGTAGSRIGLFSSPPCLGVRDGGAHRPELTAGPLGGGAPLWTRTHTCAWYVSRRTHCRTCGWGGEPGRSAGWGGVCVHASQATATQAVLGCGQGGGVPACLCTIASLRRPLRGSLSRSVWVGGVSLLHFG